MPSAVANSSDCVASRRDSGVGGISRRSEGPRRGTPLSDQDTPGPHPIFRRPGAAGALAWPHAPVLPGRRVLLRAASGQPRRGGPRRRRAQRRGDAAVRALDEPVRDDVPAHADRPRRPTTGCGSSRRARSCRSPATRPSAARTPGSRPGACRGPTDEVVQECAAGLLRIRRGERLAFAAPPLLREGPVTDDERAADPHGAGARPTTTSSTCSWGDNGPGWVVVLLRDADAVLAVRPDWSSFGDLDIGVVGAYPAGLGVRRRGAGLLPEHRRRRGPGDRQPQRQHRPVAGRRPAARVVRRLAGHGARSPPAGSTSRSDGDTVWVGGDAATTIKGAVGVGV